MAWEAKGSLSKRENQLAQCFEARRSVTSARGTTPGDGVGASSMSLNSEGPQGEEGRAPVTPVGRISVMSAVCTKMSVESQLLYADPNQTIIIYDWDDTLCPSTCMRRHLHAKKKGRMGVQLEPGVQAELNMLAEQAVPLLRASMMMGKVVIVTNAKRPWVEVSCNHFLPSVKEVLKDIPVIYALELLEDFNVEGCKEPTSLLTETKARAMKAAVSAFYSRYPRQSWKNIISIGDALFEHTAIRQVVGDRPQSQKRCRTKTIKLLEGPTVAGMVVQLSIVGSWLSKIIQMDSDVDIDLGADEESIDKWVTLFADTH